VHGDEGIEMEGGIVNVINGEGEETAGPNDD
jgi:hypothetical protein